MRWVFDATQSSLLFQWALSWRIRNACPAATVRRVNAARANTYSRLVFHVVISQAIAGRRELS